MPVTLPRLAPDAGGRIPHNNGRSTIHSPAVPGPTSIGSAFPPVRSSSFDGNQSGSLDPRLSRSAGSDTLASQLHSQQPRKQQFSKSGNKERSHPSSPAWKNGSRSSQQRPPRSEALEQSRAQSTRTIRVGGTQLVRTFSGPEVISKPRKRSHRKRKERHNRPLREADLDRIAKDLTARQMGGPASFAAIQQSAFAPIEEAEQQDSRRAFDNSCQRTNRKVVQRVRSDIGELKDRTQTIRRALHGARSKRRRTQRRVVSDIRLSRNALPPRFLRIHGVSFFLERLAETISRVMRSYWLRRWQIICTAERLMEREEQRCLLRIEQKRQATVRLAKLLTYHYSFYVRWAKRRRFLRWFDRMLFLRQQLMGRCAVKIQRIVRGHIARCHHWVKTCAATTLQRHIRGSMARLRIKRYRAAVRLQRTFGQFRDMTRAARVVQKQQRMLMIRRAFLYARYAGMCIQGWYRGIFWRRVLRRAALVLQPWWRKMMGNRSEMVCVLQKYTRRHLVHSKYKRGKWSVMRLQTYIRMQHSRRRYVRALRRRREELAKRAILLAERRREKKMRFLFREARKICGSQYIVTIMQNKQEAASITLQGYAPARQRFFEFVVKQSEIRIVSLERLLDDSAAGKNNNARSVMDMSVAYGALADRLTERKVKGDVVLKLRPKGALGERGLRVMRRGVELNETVHIVSVYLYIGSYVFDAYCPRDQDTVRLTFSAHHLHKWLEWSPADPQRPPLLRNENQHLLLTWLCTQLLVKKDKHGVKRLLLEMQMHEDRKAIMLQCMVRQRLARNAVRSQCHKVVRKIFNAEEGAFFYLYKSGLKLWHKPHLLLTEDIEVPDVWEEVEYEGETLHFHPPSGRYSRIAPDDAARMMQKRFRQTRSKDYRMGLPELVKALRMINKAEEEYKTKPDHLPAMVNYALLLQTTKFTFLQARRIYEKAQKISAQNPIILYGYALLLLIGNFYPRKKYWMMAQDFLATAKMMDTKHNAFDVAEKNFFHWGLVMKPHDARALCNFALVQQYVHGNMAQAEKFFRRAVNVAPNDPAVIQCYKECVDPDSVLTEAEKVLWKTRATRQYMLQAVETRGQHSAAKESKRKALQERLTAAGVEDKWAEAIRNDLNISTVEELQKLTEGDLIGIGVPPSISTHLLDFLGIDSQAVEAKRAQATDEIHERDAVRLIQNLFRRRNARRRMRELIKSVVYKCWDDEAGAYYYYNSKTGESKWNKPVLMGVEELEDSSTYGTTEEAYGDGEYSYE